MEEDEIPDRVKTITFAKIKQGRKNPSCFVLPKEAEMAEINKEFEAKAKATFSAERKEDIVVLVMAAIVVFLVIAGAIGPQFYSSLFFK